MFLDRPMLEGEPSGLIHRERNRQLGRDGLEDALTPEVSGRCPITRKVIDGQESESNPDGFARRWTSTSNQSVVTSPTPPEETNTENVT